MNDYFVKVLMDAKFIEDMDGQKLLPGPRDVDGFFKIQAAAV
jgi:hypothetical protein